MNPMKLLKNLDFEAMADEAYKKSLPENVYSFHKYYKQDKTWGDYILSVLISDYQHNMSDFEDETLA